jgi:DNA primase
LPLQKLSVFLAINSPERLTINPATADTTEQIRQSSDIVDVIASHVALHRAGRNMKGLCPFHSEKTPSFHVLPERQMFKCFGCGVGGDVFKFVQLRENMTFPEARAMLANRAGIALEPQRTSDASAPSKMDLERVLNWAARWFQKQLEGPSGKSALIYALDRGISESTIRQFGLGFAPDDWGMLCKAAQSQNISPGLLLAAGLVKQRDDGSLYDAFRNRLMFPIRDALNRFIGFGGRTLGDDPAKYINSPQTLLFDKSRCLYGLDSAKDAFRETKTAVIVEGYVDCIMAQQCGFTHTVATLGTALTPNHVQMLQRYVEKVIVVFDSDTAGQRAADQSLSLFVGARLDVRLANVREGKDPADLLLSRGKEAFEATLTSASSALEFKWQQVLRQCGDDATGPARRRAVEEFLGHIARCVEHGAFDPIARGFALNQVGKLLGLSSEEVSRQLRIVARTIPAAPGVVQGALPATAIVDAANRAMKDLLEVIVCAPAYFHDAAAEFDPEIFVDSELRQIGITVCELARREEGFSPSELVSRFESVETGRRIADLLWSAEQRGNHDATVAGALSRLRQVREQKSIQDAIGSLRTRAVSPATPDTIAREGQTGGVETVPDSNIRNAFETARKMNHFAARKHLTTALTAGVDHRGPQAPSQMA